MDTIGLPLDHGTIPTKLRLRRQALVGELEQVNREIANIQARMVELEAHLVAVGGSEKKAA